MHIASSTADSAGGTPTGGLDRFLEELLPVQEKIGLQVSRLRVSQTALVSLTDAVIARDWTCVGNVGADIVARSSADVYHIHDWYGAAALEHLYRSGHRRMIVTSHLPLRRGFTYRDTGVEWHVKSALENRMLGAGIRITAPSRYVADFLGEEYGLFRQRIDVVPHGVDCAFFDEVHDEVTDEAIQLLAVGRLTEQKGFDILIRALAWMFANGCGVHLTIVGYGGRRRSLARLAIELGLDQQVMFAGYKTKAELAPYYRRATLLVMPSLFEPFGLVGLEAMACGCPVIAVAPTGASEYLLPHETTTACSPARLGAALADRLAAVRGSGRSRASARTRAMTWTWERAATAYRSIYEGLR